jgi:hypothetical protein
MAGAYLPNSRPYGEYAGASTWMTHGNIKTDDVVGTKPEEAAATARKLMDGTV